MDGRSLLGLVNPERVIGVCRFERLDLWTQCPYNLHFAWRSGKGEWITSYQSYAAVLGFWVGRKIRMELGQYLVAGSVHPALSTINKSWAVFKN